MNIHEYQAKEILKKYGLELPEGILALNADEAVEAASKIKSKVWVLKAQVHAGGRARCWRALAKWHGVGGFSKIVILLLLKNY